MARFIVSHRRADKDHGWQHDRARGAMADLLEGRLSRHADLLGQNRPTHDHARHVAVFDADHPDIRRMADDLHPDLIVEPHIEHHFDHVRPATLAGVERTVLRQHPGGGRSLTVQVSDEQDKPLAGTTVYLYLSSPEDGQRQLTAVADEHGCARFEYGEQFAIVHIASLPHDGYWAMLTNAPAPLRSPVLPTASKGTGWWHQLGGLGPYAKTRGRGIRVGVIDTGLGPNANLSHVHDLGAIIDADLDERGGGDVQGHGSHVAGIIGARTTGPAQYGGVAPGCTMYSLRVFQHQGGAHQGDIALALWEMAHERRAHLVNLSLSTPTPSQIERDAILDARKVGTLCICAAGNSAGPVQYPAAFAEAIAVSAIGTAGWGPSGSLTASRRPEQPDRIGRDALFLANFSCHGPEIDVTAPGVGIVSTVAARMSGDAPYAELGGTSMASPFAAGVLAVALSRDRSYRAMPANEQRVAHAEQKLRGLACDVGLAPEYQGAGLVRAR